MIDLQKKMKQGGPGKSKTKGTPSRVEEETAEEAEEKDDLLAKKIAAKNRKASASSEGQDTFEDRVQRKARGENPRSHSARKHGDSQSKSSRTNKHTKEGKKEEGEEMDAMIAEKIAARKKKKKSKTKPHESMGSLEVV